MAAMFRVHLCKTIHFAVGERAAHCSGNRIQVFYFIVAQSKSFLPVVSCNVIYIQNRIGLFFNYKNTLIQSVVFPLQHVIAFGTFTFNLIKFLNAHNTFNSHVLGNFNGIGTPWGDHFTARSDEPAVKLFLFQELSIRKQPH